MTAATRARERQHRARGQRYSELGRHRARAAPGRDTREARRTSTAARAPSTLRAPASAQRLPVVAQRNYHERVLDHYNNPRNVGKFKAEEMSTVGTGLVRPPLSPPWFLFFHFDSLRI